MADWIGSLQHGGMEQPATRLEQPDRQPDGRRACKQNIQQAHQQACQGSAAQRADHSRHSTAGAPAGSGALDRQLPRTPTSTISNTTTACSAGAPRTARACGRRGPSPPAPPAPRPRSWSSCPLQTAQGEPTGSDCRDMLSRRTGTTFPRHHHSTFKGLQPGKQPPSCSQTSLATSRSD